MEKVLDVYKRPLDPKNPVICMDECPKQLIAETRIPIPTLPGQPKKHDYEYKRCGMCNVFIACEPLTGNRMVRGSPKEKPSGTGLILWRKLHINMKWLKK
jgi:hypothetical protein